MSGGGVDLRKMRVRRGGMEWSHAIKDRETSATPSVMTSAVPADERALYGGYVRLGDLRHALVSL